ncbi:polyamine ABC transporter substrate-binding protein [Paractinoplanes brasiliensis]|uniref:Spermidine/putrescine-binding protein n=1 Tax=Paractinoplanes brasiliensis TaxID=52695 RepID=A0A4R6JA76_9ACTN|nr:spermidine/putrescine ABC transporter substrate-binding protein [Actinoplanes brasiliensis]TDO31356.1 spermidine/putrescine-binding protein [Actinoplanes brasiliensis]GID28314.1 polyamine-binding lipoprotein [Actinoplanes brasiliensis]
MSASNLSDPSLLRGLTQRRFGRRDALRLSGLAALGGALAACGVQGQGTQAPVSAEPDAVAKFWNGKVKNGTLNFANWPLYMDPKQPEIKKFTQKTGIKVKYSEVIQEMGPWFAKVQPQLSAGQSIGYDLMVITNSFQFTQFRDSGFLAPLDHAKLPNYAKNAGAAYKKEAFDPGNAYSIPWASGMTGIAYDFKKTGREITKLADLWDPKFKGKVGMFSDIQELGNFGLMALGIDPAKSNVDDWNKAAEHLKKQKEAGIVRNYYDQSYIDALGSGEVWLTQAWSGDIFQKNISDGTDFRFVIPEEGGTIWTDNMTIPITAQNPVDALMMMDFFYEIENAATLAEYINYVCPVPAAQPVIRSHAGKASGDDKDALLAVADSKLVFPTSAEYENLHYYVAFEATSEQQKFQKTFEPIVLG